MIFEAQLRVRTAKKMVVAVATRHVRRLLAALARACTARAPSSCSCCSRGAVLSQGADADSLAARKDQTGGGSAGVIDRSGLRMTDDGIRDE